jgi:hypothetical protein
MPTKKDPLNAPHMQLKYADKWLNRVQKEKKKTLKAEKKAKRVLTKKQHPKLGCRARGRALKMCFEDGEKIRHKGSFDIR